MGEGGGQGLLTGRCNHPCLFAAAPSALIFLATDFSSSSETRLRASAFAAPLIGDSAIAALGEEMAEGRREGKVLGYRSGG